MEMFQEMALVHLSFTLSPNTPISLIWRFKYEY